MKIEDYEKGALATEAPADNDCLIRIKSQAIQFGKLLNELSKMGSRADRLKKLVFYGKALTKGERQKVLTLDMESNLTAFDDFLQDRNMARLLHAWIGLVSEASEIGNAIIECLSGGDPFNFLNARNIKEELGDSQWYITIGANAVDYDLETMMEDNNKKLSKKRFSSGKFTAIEADPSNRDTEKEVSHIEASPEVMATPYATADVVVLKPGYEQHEPYLHTCGACGQRTDISCVMDRLLQGASIGCPSCGEIIKLPVKQG